MTRAIAVGVISLFVLVTIGTGYFLTLERQTTGSIASSNLCPDDGYVSIDSGGGCPQGTELVNLDVLADSGSSETIQCCKLILDQVIVDDDVLLASADSDAQFEAAELEATDEFQLDSDLETVDDTVANVEAKSGPATSCPVLPALSVEVTCLDCVDGQ